MDASESTEIAHFNHFTKSSAKKENQQTNVQVKKRASETAVVSVVLQTHITPK